MSKKNNLNNLKKTLSDKYLQDDLNPTCHSHLSIRVSGKVSKSISTHYPLRT